MVIALLSCDYCCIVMYVLWY